MNNETAKQAVFATVTLTRGDIEKAGPRVNDLIDCKVQNLKSTLVQCAKDAGLL